MFKKSILFIALTAVVGLLSAQTLQFELGGHVLTNNEVVICDSLTSWGEMIQEMEVRNLSSETQNVYIEKEEVQMVPNTENQFCWGMCYMSTVFVSPTPMPVEGNSLNDPILCGLSFHQILDPTYSNDPANFAVGTSIVKYYAYTEANPEEKVCVEVWFPYNAESVSDEIVSVGKAYPNPATSTVSFNISFTCTLEAVVYNLLGQEVMKQTLNQGQSKVSFPVENLQPGIYFCSFIANGEPMTTEKFIVKK